MHFKNALAAVAASLATAAAQRPTNTSICDYYTTALLKNNTAENQYAVLTLVVNTVVAGNFSKINTGVAVPGILAPGNVNGTPVNLLPYFDGTLESSNRNGKGVSVNFLDGGGAAPLIAAMPANSNTTNQYFLLTHLYEFFGTLLGCSEVGMPGFPAYAGEASMYKVHEFMDLNAFQLTYFIEQVGLAALSFGVTKEDAEAVGQALTSLFGMRCSPAATVVPSQGAQLQAICIDGECPESPNPTCAAYAPVMAPVNASSHMTATAPGSQGTNTAVMSMSSMSMSASASASMSMASGSMSGSMAPSSTAPGPVTTAGAASVAATGLSLAALAGGFAALML